MLNAKFGYSRGLVREFVLLFRPFGAVLIAGYLNLVVWWLPLVYCLLSCAMNS
jgi:hypothetical protein